MLTLHSNPGLLRALWPAPAHEAARASIASFAYGEGEHTSATDGTEETLIQLAQRWHPLLPLVSEPTEAGPGAIAGSLASIGPGSSGMDPAGLGVRTEQGHADGTAPAAGLLPDYLAIAATQAMGGRAGPADSDASSLGVHGESLSASKPGNKPGNKRVLAPAGAPPAAVTAVASLPAATTGRRAGLGLVSALASMEMREGADHGHRQSLSMVLPAVASRSSQGMRDRASSMASLSSVAGGGGSVQIRSSARREILRLVRRLCLLVCLQMGRHTSNGGTWQGLQDDDETGPTRRGMASPGHGVPASAADRGQHAGMDRIRCWLCQLDGHLVHPAE